MLRAVTPSRILERLFFGLVLEAGGCPATFCVQRAPNSVLDDPRKEPGVLGSDWASQGASTPTAHPVPLSLFCCQLARSPVYEMLALAG